MKTRSLFKRIMTRAAALMAVFCVSTANIPAESVYAAQQFNAAVNATANGILEIEVYYRPTDEKPFLVQTGTGFLINETTLLTCSHVINLDDNAINVIEDVYGDEYDSDYLSVEVVALGDVTERTTIVTDSKDYDYAILTVADNTLKTKTPLVLGSAKTTINTQEVYAPGFPGVVSANQNNAAHAPFSTKDVSIQNGKISKIDYTFNDGNTMGEFIQHSALLSDGYSGGPLVDENGYVIGINKGVVQQFNYALEIDQVREMLDMKGIIYSTGETTVPDDSSDVDKEPVQTEPDPSDDEESVVPPAPITTDAPTAPGSVDTDSDDGSEDEESGGIDSTILIIAAIGGVVVILIIIIIVVAVKGGSKNSAAPYSPAPVPPYPSATPAPMQNPAPSVQQMPAPTPVYQETGAGETTLLNAGAGETSVLGGGNVPAGRAMLIRKKNGTKIVINRPDFVIGKERSKVNCCISNNAVSRQHAKITIDGGAFFITDLNSSNYTYVNDVQIPPYEPRQLNNGDIIRLADEEFEFRG